LLPLNKNYSYNTRARSAAHLSFFVSDFELNSTHFESAPFGWARDTVDGGLQVLLVAGLVRAQDERGKPVDPRGLERRAIGKTMFKVESATVSTAQRIQIRKLLQKVQLTAKQGEESACVPLFLEKMRFLADRAGGETPKPERPDTASLEEIRLTAGNEQLLALYNRRDELTQNIDAWSDLADRISHRWPQWSTLVQLMGHAKGAKDAEVIHGNTFFSSRLRIVSACPGVHVGVNLPCHSLATTSKVFSTWLLAAF